MDSLQRFMGGSPAQVLLRLIVLSLVVGIVLSALGITPAEIIERATGIARRISAMGFGAIGSAWNYFLIGAAIVVPVWLVIRLLNLGRGRG